MTNSEPYLLTHDVGTTGNKTCLYRLGAGRLELVNSALVEYPLYTLTQRRAGAATPTTGGASICEATHTQCLRNAGVPPASNRRDGLCCADAGLRPGGLRDGQVLRSRDELHWTTAPPPKSKNTSTPA
jgi:hypothetical protein